jgi:2Fe-2S ferredoxin
VAKVIILSKTQPPFELDCPHGGKLVDLCDQTSAPIPFSCRSASCGTCRVEVLEGHDAIAPPQDEELDVLDIFADDPKQRRLACCAKLSAGGVIVRVQPVDD